MTKIVYNASHGGFGLSKEAMDLYHALRRADDHEYLNDADEYDIERHDRYLVKVVELLGDKANSRFADLKVTTIKGPHYLIHEYDGLETVKTPNMIKWSFAGKESEPSEEEELLDALQEENGALYSLLKLWLNSHAMDPRDKSLLAASTAKLVRKSEALDEMVRTNQEMGLYDHSPMNK